MCNYSKKNWTKEDSEAFEYSVERFNYAMACHDGGPEVIQIDFVNRRHLRTFTPFEMDSYVELDKID